MGADELDISDLMTRYELVTGLEARAINDLSVAVTMIGEVSMTNEQFARLVEELEEP